MSQKILLEIYLDSVESATAAQEGGAHRVELCANLEAGGITPDPLLIQRVRKQISIGLHVMVRPRGGDFIYSPSEFEAMKKDIAIAHQQHADGVVFGILNKDKSIDVERTRILVELAKPMSVTFHRAFDETTEPLSALEDVIRCGAQRLLTSGQQRSAMEGIGLIAKLVQHAGKRCIIMPGAGIHEGNIRTIVVQSGSGEIHVGTAAAKNGVVDRGNIRKLLKNINNPDRE